MSPQLDDHIRSFTELLHLCEANAHEFEMHWSEVLRHLNNLGVDDAEYQFANSIGESVESWRDSVGNDYAPFQIQQWCRDFCTNKIFEVGEVPLAWNTSTLGIPPIPVNTIEGLIVAFESGFKTLHCGRGSDWNKLTVPETDLARSLLDAIQQQALLLDIDVPETDYAENMDLIQQLLDVRKILSRAAIKQQLLVGVTESNSASCDEKKLARPDPSKNQISGENVTPASDTPANVPETEQTQEGQVIPENHRPLVGNEFVGGEPTDKSSRRNMLWHLPTESPPERFKVNGPLVGTKKELAIAISGKPGLGTLDTQIRNGTLWGREGVRSKSAAVWFFHRVQYNNALNSLEANRKTAEQQLTPE